MALTDKLTNIADAIREKTGSTRTMNLEGMANAINAIQTGSGGTTDHSKLENRDAADQHPISAITGLEDELANKQPSGEYLTQEDLQAATDTALAAAKASGEFDGADGKSAYQYARDGGYTGTEEQFAAKLAKEKFANPNALTFTGAVEGSYDGSEPLAVEIPSGGSDAWNLIEHITAEDAAISYAIPLQPGAKEYGICWEYTNNDVAIRDISVDESLAEYGVMYRNVYNDNAFIRIFRAPNSIAVLGINTRYAAPRTSTGGTYIGSGTDFPAMTLRTNKACTTSEIWVYWR